VEGSGRGLISYSHDVFRSTKETDSIPQDYQSFRFKIWTHNLLSTNVAYRIAPSRIGLTKLYSYHVCMCVCVYQYTLKLRVLLVCLQLCFDKRKCIVVVHHFPPSLSYQRYTESSHSRNWKRSLPRLDKIASQHVELRILVAFIQRCVPFNRHHTCSFKAWNSACPEVQVWTPHVERFGERAALPWSATCSLFLLWKRRLFM
jgi:hypothetical protein